MEENLHVTPLIRDMVTHIEGTEPAAEELRQALNGIIARYHIHPSVVISLLARLSAGFIHLTQQMYDKKNADEVVEEDFQNFLTATLTDIDMSDVKREMEKIKNENLN